jgi:hypothetical protein
MIGVNYPGAPYPAQGYLELWSAPDPVVMATVSGVLGIATTSVGVAVDPNYEDIAATSVGAAVSPAVYDAVAT